MFDEIENNTKKRLMIDVMCFCQSYEKRKIIEIKQIKQNNNSINAMTKTKSSNVLKILINNNKINIERSNKLNKTLISKQKKIKYTMLHQKNKMLMNKIVFRKKF